MQEPLLVEAKILPLQPRPDPSTPPQECAHCQAEAASLYRLAILDRDGGRTVWMVCRFCYLRIAGIRPRRSDLARIRVVK